MENTDIEDKQKPKQPYVPYIDKTSKELKNAHVVVKFYTNIKSEHKDLVTRTMGKVGLIKREWYEKNPNRILPRHKELWRVRVVQETAVGQDRGCFFIEPIEQILPIDIIKLVNGMYTEKEKNGILFITPFRNDLPFILPLLYKRHAIAHKCYATVVKLSSKKFTSI